MSNEMDAISFYGTLGAIFLLQISFYWLFRDDHYKRQMTPDEIGQQRLLILLACSGESCSTKAGGESLAAGEFGGQSLVLWKQRLEQIGFIIYELRLDEQVKQLTFNKSDRVISLAISRQKHLDQAVCLLEQEIKLHDRKLHAFVSLPRQSSGGKAHSQSRHHPLESNSRDSEASEPRQQKAEQAGNGIRPSCGNNKLINLIRDDHFQSHQLLSALSPIFNPDSRTIQVQSRAAEQDQTAATPGEQSKCLCAEHWSSLTSLQMDIEALVNDYLRSQLARSNCGQLIELVSEWRADRTWFARKVTDPSTNKTRSNNTPEQVHCKQTECDESISEKDGQTSRLLDELQRLIMLVNPRDRIYLT